MTSFLQWPWEDSNDIPIPCEDDLDDEADLRGLGKADED